MKYLFLALLALGACKNAKDTSALKSLEDLERGSYSAEVCKADSNSTITYDISRIRAYGVACNDTSKLLPSSKVACDSVIDSIKTLPRSYQTLLNRTGMSVLVSTKSATEGITNAAFKSDAVSIANATSFWTAASHNGDDYLATVIRVDSDEDARKQISYSVLRTLGDFFARGAFSLNKNGDGFIIDPTQTAALPDEYLEAQASLTYKFLNMVKNKTSNPLLMSIVKGNKNLLESFPSNIKRNLEARNLASYVTTEALHQYYCNTNMRKKLEAGGKYESLMPDLNKIFAAIDLAVGLHTGIKSVKPRSYDSSQSLSLTQTNMGFLAQLMAYLQNNRAGSVAGSESEPASNSETIQQVPQQAAGQLGALLAQSGCSSCNGNCSCSGGNCSCASGGCSCCSGGSCNCVGGCSCGAVSPG